MFYSIVTKHRVISLVLLLIGMVNTLEAAVSIDRTRVILLGDEKSSPINVINHSKTLPYLVQTWLENEAGEKINSPLTVLPPLQRVEPDSTVQVRITPLPEAMQLPQDRESMFFFALQEIPPKSGKSNVIQLALRIKVKLFYRPAAVKSYAEQVWQEEIRLEPGSQGLKLVNPTPLFIILPEVIVNQTKLLAQNEAVTLKPKSEEVLTQVKPQAQKITLQYINDYGAYKNLNYTCTASSCVRDKS